MYPLDDTIAAIASPPGGAARGIVRISGPDAFRCVEPFFEPNADGRKSNSSPCALDGQLRIPGLHSPLPCELYVWGNPASIASVSGRACPPFLAEHVADADTPRQPTRSYTGQPVVEIHTLGSPPLLQLLLRSICEAGARLAGPGEFTLRAFLAGRIDLTQAEAVLGVIDAEDSHALKVAIEQLAGGLARPLHRLRDGLLDLLAHLEAGFDFADEDLAFLSPEKLDRQLAEAEQEVLHILDQMRSRGEATETVTAVLVGRPNTGKSSLFNALAGARAALVSDEPGTTRDYLVAELDLDGARCRLIDTAGHVPAENAADALDRAAEAMADRQRRAARLQVLCLDSTRPPDDWERSVSAAANDPRWIVVHTKCDASAHVAPAPGRLETSSRTGIGIAALRAELRCRTLAAGAETSDVVAGTAVRCAESLRRAGQSLRRAREVAGAGQEELAAAEMRAALDDLGNVVGAVFTEDVLDRIFSRFCVGK